MNENEKIAINIPCKVVDLIDTLISHNELIALWSIEDPYGNEENKNYSYLEWRGMAHKIPEIFKYREADCMNILIK